MKSKFLNFILITFICFGNSIKALSQNIVLIDRQFAWHSYLCDSLTSAKYSTYLPLYVSEIDSLISKLEPLTDLSKLGMERTYIDENMFATGHITFKIQNVGGAYGDKYNVLLISQIQSYQFSIRLAASEWDAYSSKRQILDFRNHLIKVKKDIAKGKVKLNCSPK